MKRFLTCALPVGLLAILSYPVYGAAELLLSDGVSSVLIADGGVDDTDAAAGIVGFSGAVGNFTVNVTTGLTIPAIGSSEAPILDVISFNSTTGAAGGGTLDVTFTATDFGGPKSTYNFGSAIGGTTGGTVGMTTYLDGSNSPFGTGQVIAALGPLSGAPTAFAAEQPDVLVDVDGVFSLTLGVQVNHSGANQHTSFNGTLSGVAIPEPASIITWCLLGCFALGTSWCRWRKRVR